jgi:hypothetical protein
MSLDVRDKVLELHDNNFTERGISSVLGVSRGGVRSVLAKAGRINYLATEKTDRVMALYRSGMGNKEIAEHLRIPVSTTNTIIYYANEREKIIPAKDAVEEIVEERVGIRKNWKPGRYMVVSDLHVVFHNLDVLDQVLGVKGDFDGCVITGDLIDEYWISSFRKSERITREKELLSATAVIKLLIRRFGRVLYFMGNHEDRRWKRFLEALQPAAELAEDKAYKLFAQAKDIQGWHAKDIPGLTVHYNWWVDICNGAVILSHPDRFNSVPGSAVKNVVEHFYNHRRDYNLGEIDLVAMGHIHRMDGPKHRLGIWTCELPAMCGILPYQVGSKASNAGTIDTGYFVLTTKPDGSMSFNESRIYLLEKPQRRQLR